MDKGGGWRGAERLNYTKSDTEHMITVVWVKEKQKYNINRFTDRGKVIICSHQCSSIMKEAVSIMRNHSDCLHNMFWAGIL